MELIQVAKRLLSEAMGLTVGESLLVVSDTTREEIAQVLCQAGVSLGAEIMEMTLLPRSRSGEEPPSAVAAAMAAADVVVCPTQYSLTHTQARKFASERGSRVATMPGITLEMFEQGPVTADFGQVAALSLRVAEVLTQAKQIRIEQAGAVFQLDVTGRNGIASTGVYKQRGESGNLPSGEAYIAPVEGRAFGELIVDGSMGGLGLLTSPLHLTVRDGLLVQAEGERAAEWLQILGDSPAARNVAELGIGTNPQARLTGVILEDEKAYGTIHVAFGSNATFGGTVEAGIHLDGVIRQPTLYVDDQRVMENGVLLL
ncbi:aminopeptidase [Alicyclobacillaceae bacterium I2511]|nr:aminopeptidase [Alicyclobacillaceae bacterium I2511]